jgi:hypothetical protein
MEQRPLYSLWRFDFHKAGRCEQIIFTALVHHAYVTVSLGVLIGHNSVDLVQFKGGGIAIVVYAYNEALCSGFSFGHGL